jgi:hypothetical protein
VDVDTLTTYCVIVLVVIAAWAMIAAAASHRRADRWQAMAFRTLIRAMAAERRLAEHGLVVPRSRPIRGAAPVPDPVRLAATEDATAVLSVVRDAT